MKTVKAIVIAVCAMLMLGTFAMAQGYGRGERYGGRWRSPTAQALSDLIEAHDILAAMPRDNNILPYMQNMLSASEEAIDQLQKGLAAAGIDPNRLPPPDPTNRNASSLERANFLVERASRLLASGREPNGDLRERGRQVDHDYVAQVRISMEKALRQGDQQQGYGYDERDRRGY